MCGIAGQARADGAPVDPELVARMCAAQEHRGPDSRGVHTDAGVGLGIQRLAIIDLQTGDQPIFNEDRSVVVVLNGEIYNFRELRARLEASGHRFSSGTDTEVIVHLYEEEGPRCVESLHGMFGLAIWDARRRQLVLARDRVGKKPLFYSCADGVLRFASELNALMADPAVPRDVDHTALDAYLAYRWVPGPRSAFAAVRKLPAGSTLVFRDGEATIERYWELSYEPKRAVGSEAELDEQLREHIRAAVRRRLVADVPLGAFLSGGIDSSAVVAAMTEAASTVRTFSIGFTSAAHNELPLARLVADRFGTQHEEFIVEPDALSVLPKIVQHYGEPFADSSAVPSFYLAQMTARHVTVALNGDGGDESFAGYQRYVSNAAAARMEQVPAPLRRMMARAAERLPQSERQNGVATRARRFGAALALDPASRYRAYMTQANGFDFDRLYTDDYRALVGESAAPGVVAEPWADSGARHIVDRMLDVDVRTYLADDLLVKMDIASMAYSLEARSPLLDHELMEFAASLPPDHKLRGTQKKVGLRRALRGWVPDEILDAPKRGFQMPVAEWLRGSLGDFARELLLDRTTVDRGYFRANYVKELLDRHAARQADHQHAIWTLLNYELWHRAFVDAPVAGPPATALR